MEDMQVFSKGTENSDAAKSDLAVKGQNKVFDAASTDSEATGITKATEKANNIVTEVFGQAVVHTVSNDEQVREQLLTTAKQVVQDKASAIGDAASAESTAQHFKKHEDACGYFGYDEKTTTKFHVDFMAAVMFVINTIYIATIGSLVVAPIAFILSKLRVIVKKLWVAVLLAILIYFVIALLPVAITKIVSLLSV